jgi:DNA-binding XRE family transcriptional regulator
VYIFKNNKRTTIRQVEASKVIGVSQSTLSSILRGKLACSKVMAYAITKYFDENAEIEDYFVRKED